MQSTAPQGLRSRAGELPPGRAAARSRAAAPAPAPRRRRTRQQRPCGRGDAGAGGGDEAPSAAPAHPDATTTRWPRALAAAAASAAAAAAAAPPLLSLASAFALPPLALPAGFDALPVAQALLVLAGVVAVHEAGHLSAAKALRVRVSKFAVGFGPALVSTVAPDGIEYSLGLVPLGGYVGFPDDDPDCPWPKDDPDLLRNRPVAHRAAVASAGVAANAAAALLLLTVQAATVGQLASVALPGVRVPDLPRGPSAARDAGIRVGDVIAAIDGAPLGSERGEVARLVRCIVDASPGKPLDFTLLRPGEPAPLLVSVTPSRGGAGGGGGGRLGISLEPNSRLTHVVAPNPAAALQAGAADFVRLAGVVWAGLAALATNFGETAEQVSGPIAIIATGARVAKGDPAGLFQFASILNINLAIVNLLPLPALDGGFLALLGVEALTGRRLPTWVEQAIAGSGFVILLSVGVYMLLRDTVRLTGL